MTPRVRSGSACELEPVYLHLITALEKERVQIGNNHGRINGWTQKTNVYGRLTRVNNSGSARRYGEES